MYKRITLDTPGTSDTRDTRRCFPTIFFALPEFHPTRHRRAAAAANLLKLLEYVGCVGCVGYFTQIAKPVVRP
jgi:hypothetical protein